MKQERGIGSVQVGGYHVGYGGREGHSEKVTEERPKEVSQPYGYLKSIAVRQNSMCKGPEVK